MLIHLKGFILMFKKLFFYILLSLPCSLFFFKEIKNIDEHAACGLYQDYINDDKFFAILQYIYQLQPSFFNGDPADCFPISPSNMIDLFYTIEPLLNFLDPLVWGNIVFPMTLLPVADSFDELLKKSENTDLEKYNASHIVVIKGATYPAMKKQLLYVLNMANESGLILPIFLLANTERLNTNLYYESFDYIVNDLQIDLGRSLVGDELNFISQHLSNEYGLALIINQFYNTNNNFTLVDVLSDPLLNNFDMYLMNNGYDYANILFISNNIFGLYHELRYLLNTLDYPEDVNVNFPVTFAGEAISLVDPINPEGILLRKLKMVAVLYTMLIDHIDD
jgi:hypothetical protein